MIEPAPRQRLVLELVSQRLVRGEPSPTIRELLADIGATSTNGMREHLRALRRKGLVTFTDNERRRGARITEAGWRLLGFRGRLCRHCHVPVDPEKRRHA